MLAIKLLEMIEFIIKVSNFSPFFRKFQNNNCFESNKLSFWLKKPLKSAFWLVFSCDYFLSVVFQFENNRAQCFMRRQLLLFFFFPELDTTTNIFLDIPQIPQTYLFQLYGELFRKLLLIIFKANQWQITKYLIKQLSAQNTILS